MSTDTHARQPAGTPVGGQFAATTRAETGTQLDASGGRRAGMVDAVVLVNGAYGSIINSDLLDSLRADTEDGAESDYPHAEHSDAVRALRRYRDALAGRASGDGGTVPGVLPQPLSRYDAVEAADDDGWLTVTVRADLGELVNAGYHNDDYTVDDALAEKALKGMPYDSSYRVVGVDEDGDLLVEFTTNVKGEVDAQHGDGTFDECRTDGGEVGVCVDCDKVYELAEGHDCPDAPASHPEDGGGCEHRAYAGTCPQCRTA